MAQVRSVDEICSQITKLEAALHPLHLKRELAENREDIDILDQKITALEDQLCEAQKELENFY